LVLLRTVVAGAASLAMNLAFVFTIYLRGLVLSVLFLPGDARRARGREALDLSPNALQRPPKLARAAHLGPHRTKAPLRTGPIPLPVVAASGPEEDKLLPKDDEQSSELCNKQDTVVIYATELTAPIDTRNGRQQKRRLGSLNRVGRILASGNGRPRNGGNPIQPAASIPRVASCLLPFALPRPFAGPRRRGRSMTMSRFDPPSEAPEPEGSSDPRLRTVILDRNTGIDFGCDITLRWPYVLSLTPGGSAARLGLVDIGDQLVAVESNSVVGLPIARVVDTMAAVKGRNIQLTFFKGSRQELQELMGKQEVSDTVCITLQQAGKPDVDIEVPYGANLRDELISRGYNVYQSVSRWTNCNGKELCGTCIVDMVDGIQECTVRSVDEANKLRDYPATYKFSCQTNVYGNVTVRLFPKVGAAQLVGR